MLLSPVGPRGCAIIVTALVVGGGLFAIPLPSTAAPVVDTIMPAAWPTALAFSPDGRIFYTERITGQIRIVEGGNLLPTPFYTLPDTATSGERGLLGLALDPGFPATPWVYAYQTYDEPPVLGTIYNRIVRIQASGNVGVAMEVLLAMPPLSAATNHNGGVIAFGPDGKLYAVVGENANIALAQNQLSPMGKVLRMNPDGSVPTDNPFFGNPAWHPLIFTYGHRNMFGLAFHPDTNGIFVTENGPNCNDEVNLLVPGGNFAWGTSQTCASPPPPPQNTNQDGPLPHQMPLWWWTPTICPTNAAIYRGPYFPGWYGDLFMGDCNNGDLHRLDVSPSGDAVLSDTIVWPTPSAIIEVEEAPDGSIWFTTPTTIYRYRDANRPPNAAFLAAPQNTIPGVTVTFDASFSTDPDGSIISYDWEFGDGALGTGSIATHAYASPGLFLVNLTVTDDEGLQDAANATVTVNAPPFATFTANPSPANPGQVVTFNASGSADDGTIVSYDWEFGDGNVASGLEVTHAYATSGTYDVVLTITDDMGLSDRDTQSLRINAPPVAGFTANPSPVNPGQAVTFDASATLDDGPVAGYAWDFGDGNVATGSLVTHAYAVAGTYTVTLNVTDDLGLWDRDVQTLRVNAAPVAAFTANRTSSFIGVPFLFTSTPSDDGPIASHAWAFGDGGIASGASVVHAYAAKGTFEVTLTVTDDLGLSAVAMRVFVVANRGPVITSAAPDGTNVTATAQTPLSLVVAAEDPDGDALTYEWFVDGVAVSAAGPGFDFSAAQPGEHRVRVVVSDGELQDSREWTITVVERAPSFPWVEIALVVGVALALLLAFLWRRRRRPAS